LDRWIVIAILSQVKTTLRKGIRYEYRREVDLNKLELLELANYLKNVSEALRVMGYSRDTFYRVKNAYHEGGIEALKEKTRRLHEFGGIEALKEKTRRLHEFGALCLNPQNKPFLMLLWKTPPFARNG